MHCGEAVEVLFCLVKLSMNETFFKIWQAEEQAGFPLKSTWIKNNVVIMIINKKERPVKESQLQDRIGDKHLQTR